MLKGKIPFLKSMTTIDSQLNLVYICLYDIQCRSGSWRLWTVRADDKSRWATPKSWSHLKKKSKANSTILFHFLSWFPWSVSRSSHAASRVAPDSHKDLTHHWQHHSLTRKRDMIRQEKTVEARNETLCFPNKTQRWCFAHAKQTKRSLWSQQWLICSFWPKFSMKCKSSLTLNSSSNAVRCRCRVVAHFSAFPWWRVQHSPTLLSNMIYFEISWNIFWKHNFWFKNVFSFCFFSFSCFWFCDLACRARFGILGCEASTAIQVTTKKHAHTFSSLATSWFPRCSKILSREKHCLYMLIHVYTIPVLLAFVSDYKIRERQKERTPRSHCHVPRDTVAPAEEVTLGGQRRCNIPPRRTFVFKSTLRSHKSFFMS